MRPVVQNTGSGCRPDQRANPFGLLTLVVSLVAISLSIFLLLGQRRESAIAELREEITLQITLRVEEEVTKSLQLLSGLYSRLGHRIGDDRSFKR